MLENERSISNDWSAAGGILEYDISYLHPALGVLAQEYHVSSTDDEGKRIFQSHFLLFGPNDGVPSSFRHLPRAVKQRLWEIVFAVKRKFFEEIKPEIVEHFIDPDHSIEQRYQLFVRWLTLPDYDIEKTKHTIVYQRKSPAKPGGGFLV